MGIDSLVAGMMDDSISMEEFTAGLKAEALRDIEIENELYGNINDDPEEEEHEENPDKLIEAVKRMRKLHLMPQIIQEFEKDQSLVQYSEPVSLGKHRFGALYWVQNNPDWMKQVKEFEEKYNSLVYHAVHSYTEFGEMLSLLYVSDYPEEWIMDNEDLEDGYAMTYTINLDCPEYSEFGSIAVIEASGGLLRVG